jgi:(E)-4-hydroxy-3-methylbut-2-enyl-diphosphate synthase
MQRQRTLAVDIGGVGVGGDHPIVVQSMTNTDTSDISGTVSQIGELSRAGSELVRITVDTPKAAEAVPEIVKRLVESGIDTPVIGDFHFNGHILLTEYPECASALAKYRINPGNVGIGRQHDPNFQTILDIAKANGKAVRIGVNWGSLDQTLVTELMDSNADRDSPADAQRVVLDAMVESAVRSVEFADSIGFPRNRIILSAKVSRAVDLLPVYRNLARRTDCPLHLGLTEAGLGRKGVVASAAAMAPLLLDGIGDTVRVSLTPAPGGDRTEEVRVARDLLQSLGLRCFSPEVSACPGCGRTTSSLFQEMATEIQGYLDQRMPEWKAAFPGSESLRVAVMGCIVNGPGESKHADVGISLPGNGEEPRAPVYVDSRLMTTLSGDSIVPDFISILNDYVEQRYSK